MEPNLSQSVVAVDLCGHVYRSGFNNGITPFVRSTTTTSVQTIANLLAALTSSYGVYDVHRMLHVLYDRDNGLSYVFLYHTGSAKNRSVIVLLLSLRILQLIMFPPRKPRQYTMSYAEYHNAQARLKA
jgi:hypothetical protein